MEGKRSLLLASFALAGALLCWPSGARAASGRSAGAATPASVAGVSAPQTAPWQGEPPCDGHLGRSGALVTLALGGQASPCLAQAPSTPAVTTNCTAPPVQSTVRCPNWLASYLPAGDIQLTYPARIGTSSDGHAVFVAGLGYQGNDTVSDGVIAAYAASSGAQLWVATVSDPTRSWTVLWDLAMSPDGRALYVAGQSVALSGATIFLDGQGNSCTSSRKFIAAYDTTTGAELWETTVGDPSQCGGMLSVTTSADGSRVVATGDQYAPGAYSSRVDGVVAALSATNGSSQWQTLYPRLDISNPQVFLGRAAITPDGSTAVVAGFLWSIGGTYPDWHIAMALDVSTGAVAWEHDTSLIGASAASWANDVVVRRDGGAAYFNLWRVDGSGHSRLDVVAVDPRTGVQLWDSLDTADQAYGIIMQGPVFLGLSADQTRVYAAQETIDTTDTAYTGAVALDAATGSRLWGSFTPASDFAVQDLPGSTAVAPSGSVDVSSVFFTFADESSQNLLLTSFDGGTGATQWLGMTQEVTYNEYPQAGVLGELDGSVITAGSEYDPQAGHYNGIVVAFGAGPAAPVPDLNPPLLSLLLVPAGCAALFTRRRRRGARHTDHTGAAEALR
jgi:hypothetical protein